MLNELITQTVSEVERATQSLDETSPKSAIEALIGGKVEACSEYHGKVVAVEIYHSSLVHPFVAAVNAAFCDHRPLVLSPDMVWLLIGQGFARHVNNNSDALRSHFVKHDKQKAIVVRRDDFLKGSLENPWNEVFSEFSENIKQHIGQQNYSNIVASFSTTGTIEKAASEIVLMDSMQRYFDYVVFTSCGIPAVTLEGTAEDWHQLCQRTELLGSTYDLAWWTNRIVPTLKRIARNAAGADDPELWKNIYKIDQQSGGPYINGWLVDFFPYLSKNVSFHEKIDIRNRSFSDGNLQGIETDAFPGSLCKVPFLWNYLGREIEMEFLAGFIGFTQDAETLAVRPKIGWAVREAQSHSFLK